MSDALTFDYVIIGAGKTAVDACLWLLEIGVSPDDIRWIKPRESWYLNRVFAQGGELVGTLFEGISLQVEAAARATSVDDLFARRNIQATHTPTNADAFPLVPVERLRETPSWPDNAKVSFQHDPKWLAQRLANIREPWSQWMIG